MHRAQGRFSAWSFVQALRANSLRPTPSSEPASSTAWTPCSPPKRGCISAAEREQYLTRSPTRGAPRGQTDCAPLSGSLTARERPLCDADHHDHHSREPAAVIFSRGACRPGTAGSGRSRAAPRWAPTATGCLSCRSPQERGPSPDWRCRRCCSCR